jgi:hypothetical protein
MPTTVNSPRLLVKAQPGSLRSSLQLAAGSVEFQIEPLFTSIGVGSQLGATAMPVWHVLTPAQPLDRIQAWNVCHELVRTGLGLDGGPAVEFAEPDLVQQWLPNDPGAVALAAASTCADSKPPDARFPLGSDPLWFHDDAHAEFVAALTTLGDVPPNDLVRVAHLDSGYDASHETLPVHLNSGLQRNLVDGDRPGDASDTSSGPLNAFGHGTGTLGVLAGNRTASLGPIGAAPFVEVVPVRVANSVVLFENSAIARAFDYVHGLCANPQTQVHVITMSMGGIGYPESLRAAIAAAATAWRSAPCPGSGVEDAATRYGTSARTLGISPTRLVIALKECVRAQAGALLRPRELESLWHVVLRHALVAYFAQA